MTAISILIIAPFFNGLSSSSIPHSPETTTYDFILTPPSVTTPESTSIKPNHPMHGFLSDEELLDRGKKHLAYNCDITQNMKFSQYNQLEVEDCHDIASSYKGGLERQVQLIQRRKTMGIEVLHCSLLVSLTTSYCSTDFFSGARHWEGNTIAEDIQIQLSRAECNNALKHRTLKYQDRQYHNMEYITIDIPESGKTSGWRVLRGAISPTKGTCEASSFAVHNDYYPSHTLSMRYTATIQLIQGEINLHQKAMRVTDHVVVSDISQGMLYHPEGGNFFWEVPNPNTSTDLWQEISTGTAKIFKPIETSLNQKQSIAIINTTTSNLAMTIDTPTKICLHHACRKSYQTNVEDVFLVIIKLGQNIWDIEKLEGSEISRLTEFQAASNSIFLSQELKLGKSFDEVSQLLCQRSKEIIEASIDNFLRNKKGSSHLIHKGSVIYSFPCRDTVVWLTANSLNHSMCYEFPEIRYKGKNSSILKGFINPVTWVIENHSPVHSCNDDILEYKIGLRALDYSIEWLCRRNGGRWSTMCSPPQTIAPLHPGKLYHPNSEIIHTNLYSQEQLSQLELHQWESETRGLLSDELQELLIRENNRNPGTGIEGVLSRIISRLTKSESNSNIYTEEIADGVSRAVLLWYIFNVINGLPRNLQHLRKTYGTSRFDLTLVFNLSLCLLKAVLPVVTRESNNCPCRSPAYMDEVYEVMQSKDKEKFLKDLQF